MPESIPPGPLSEPTAKRLTRALARLAGLLRLRTTPPLALTWAEDQPLLYLAGERAGGGSDDSFWAALVGKTAGTCPLYTFRRVSPGGFSCGWTVDDPESDPEETAIEVNAIDLPVNDPELTGNSTFHVVRMRPQGGQFVFAEPPRWDFVRPTSATPDANGYYDGVLLYFGPGNTAPTEGEEIYILDLNATP